MLRLEVYREIERIVKEMREVEGVVGIILFGSYSRGEQEEGSDIDLLTVFRDERSLKENQEEIYKITAKSNLFLQVITLTIKELKSSHLLKSVIRDGKAYYLDREMKKLLNTIYVPYALITYRMTNLKPKDKVTFIQKLEGRGKGKYRYKGLIQELNGYKVGKGVIMIPVKNLKKITEYLEKKNVDYVIRYVWV